MEVLKYWTVNNFELSSYKWRLKEKMNKTIRTAEDINAGECTYTFNSLGFRGDEPNKDGFNIMFIGDSCTEGVGVDDDKTWPARFTKLIPNGVNNNFGVAGRSNDYIVRCLLTYYDLIKPDLVIIMYTAPVRREIYTENCFIEPYNGANRFGYLDETDEGKRIQSLKLQLQNDNEDFVNWYKNHLLIKYFLESKKCNWIWDGWMGIDPNYKEFNRFESDYMHYIDYGADGKHPGCKHNNYYAFKLYNFIYKNFREYLPKECDDKSKYSMI